MATYRDRGTHPLSGPHPLDVAGAERQPAIHHEPVVREHDTPDVRRRDLVRWGPVWAGLVVTLSTFLLLELVLFALGILDLRQGEQGSAAGGMSGLIGFVAFFVGGLTAGATAMWRSAKDGALHGLLVWASTTMGFILLTLFGGGAVLGPAAEVLTQVASLQLANLPDVDAASAVDAARTATSWAVLGLVLALLAAAVGGALGGRMWHRKDVIRHGASS